MALERAGFEFRRQTGSHTVTSVAATHSPVWSCPTIGKSDKERSGASSLTLD
jgi:hypothetical protein